MNDENFSDDCERSREAKNRCGHLLVSALEAIQWIEILQRDDEGLIQVDLRRDWRGRKRDGTIFNQETHIFHQTRDIAGVRHQV